MAIRRVVANYYRRNFTMQECGLLGNYDKFPSIIKFIGIIALQFITVVQHLRTLIEERYISPTFDLSIAFAVEEDGSKKVPKSLCFIK